MRVLTLTCALALMIGAATPALADIVDFNALPQGNNPNPLVVNGVTFTTDSGFNYIGFLGTNELCPSISANNPANCSRPFEVSFGQTVGAVSFGFNANNTLAIGADVGDVAVYNGATLLGIRNLVVVDADSFSLDLVDLSEFASLTRLVVTPDDFGGLLYDNFRFSAAGGVPEPASWAMMIAGFATAGVAARRRRPAALA